MKLPNFLEDHELNTLKAKMGIPKNVLGTLDHNEMPHWEKTLLKNTGIPLLNLKDIIPLSDGTIVYKNQRGVLYIHDVSSYKPKFHIANCKALQEMKANNRFDKYIFAQNETGIFEISIISDPKNPILKHEKLDVCRYCLDFLAWQGYSSSEWKETQKSKCVEKFKLKEFFKIYPYALHNKTTSSNNTPINLYPDEWANISYNIREKSGWTCEQCKINLSAIEYHKFLHVHHKNGIKYDNHRTNLEVLCIGCHAEQYKHQHIKNNDTYWEFMQRFKPTINKQRGFDF